MIVNQDTKFRELNENEHHILLKLAGIRNVMGDNGHIPCFAWDELKVSYEIFSGAFVCCLIRLWVPQYQITLIWRGVSRCSYQDRFNQVRGEVYAFRRAILESQPVEI